MRGCMGSRVAVYPVRVGLCASGMCMGVHVRVYVQWLYVSV